MRSSRLIPSPTSLSLASFVLFIILLKSSFRVQCLFPEVHAQSQSVTNTFNFCFSENIFILFSFLNGSLTEYRVP